MTARAAVAFPFPALARPLDAKTRRAIDAEVRALLRFQRTLEGFPRLRATTLDAAPFVSLYARGALRGCFGSDDPTPKQRLARAFLRALHDDARFGPIADDDRRALTAQVSYLRAPRRIDDVTGLEPGLHGIAIVHPAGQTLILPGVLRARSLHGEALLEALAKKARLDRAAAAEATLFAFETDDVIVRPGKAAAVDRGDPLDGAARWLARLVDGSGHVAYAVDAGTNTTRFVGEFHHGRAAIVIRALARHGGHARVVERARTRMKRDIEGALGGEAIEGWPRDRAHVAAAIALAVLAGVEVRTPLRALLDDRTMVDALVAAPWHAAQVVAALAREAPPPLFRACLDDLHEHPWAPWTAIAARALDDATALAMVRPPLLRSIRERAPMLGGVAPEGKAIAETALTAIVLEALPHDEPALAPARDFVSRMQLVPARVPAHLDRGLASWAFAASPLGDVLRGDITAHAFLALSRP